MARFGVDHPGARCTRADRTHPSRRPWLWFDDYDQPSAAVSRWTRRLQAL